MSVQPFASDLLTAPVLHARNKGTVFEFLRYFAASGLALGADLGIYALSLHLGLAYSVAALFGFSAGAIVAYVISVKWVFDARMVARAWLEFALFVVVGIFGLLLTEAALWLEIERFGWPPVISKVAAAGFVFMFNFFVRKTMLFRNGKR